MNDTEAAYLAGLFDGEGTIIIATTKGRRNIPHQWLMIAIGQARREIIDSLHAQYGGTVINLGKSPSYIRRQKRPLFSWRLDGRQAASFLEAILPFLRIKTEQAMLGIRFEREKRSLHNVRDERIINIEVGRRASLRAQIRWFTARSPGTFATDTRHAG